MQFTSTELISSLSLGLYCTLISTMTTIASWIDTIGLETILSLAPHGLFDGCGGTSNFVAQMMRERPVDEASLFGRLRDGDYFDAKPVDEETWSANELPSALDSIRKRLETLGYVKVSFYTEEEEEPEVPVCSHEEIASSILKLVNSRPPAKLFDHSFILYVRDGATYRLESYIGEYAPRNVEWSAYETDLKRLFDQPETAWREVFGVETQPQYDLDIVKLTIAN